MAEWEITAQSVRRIFAMDYKPTALILPDDYAALAVYRTLSQLNVKIPNEISLMGYDGLEFSQVMNPRLTTIKQDTNMIGKLAARKMISLIEDNAGHEVIFVPTRIMEGKSVKRL